jgi:hypothetical protein
MISISLTLLVRINLKIVLFSHEFLIYAKNHLAPPNYHHTRRDKYIVNMHLHRKRSYFGSLSNWNACILI